MSRSDPSDRSDQSDRSVSVIISSYNQPNTLRLVLAGFTGQTDRNFELLIADDGSEPDTAQLVESFKVAAPFPVAFVTQPHTNFGKPRILNSAVLRSTGDQLIFCDGDCVPFRNFVAVHRRSYRPNCFCTAGYVRVRLAAAKLLTLERVQRGEHELLLRPMRRWHLVRTHWKNRFYQIAGKKHEPKIQGGNWSVDRAAFFAVNGFDEEFCGLSKSDSDIRNRLRNHGAEGISLWHRAFVCHLDHGLDVRRTVKSVIRAKTGKEFYLSRRDAVRAVIGLEQHQAAEAGR